MASGPTITARFLADTSQLTGEVDKASRQAGGRLDSFAKNAAVAIGGAFAVGKVLDFGKAAVRAAADDAEAQDQLAAALANTTGATEAQIKASEKYISSLSKSAAIADDELRPALATLARGFGNTEDAQKALTIATDVAAGTGKDLAAVTAAMAKGAQGSTGALTKLGVATKDAAGHALSMDQIMANLATTFDGQAKIAAESTAGQMRAADIAMGEFSESIGTTVMPIVAKLAEVFTTTLLPAIDAIIGNKVGLIALTVVVVALFASWVAGAVAAAAATLLPLAPFIAIGAAIAAAAIIIVKNWDAIKGAALAVFNWFKDNWPLLLAIITGPFGLAVLAISKNWDSIKGFAVGVFDWFKDTWSTVTDLITKPIRLAADALKGLIDGIKRTVSTIVNAIKDPINLVLRGWNAIEFTLPKITIGKVEVLGKTIFPGVSVGGQTIGFPDIPELAAGGVLTAPTLFVGGEAGTEIVAPEDMLRSIMREEAGGNYTLNVYPRTADAADIAYGFRRLELLAGIR